MYYTLKGDLQSLDSEHKSYMEVCFLRVIYKIFAIFKLITILMFDQGSEKKGVTYSLKMLQYRPTVSS